MSRVLSPTFLSSRRAFTGIVPFQRQFKWVLICLTGRDKCSQLSSDMYDIYYANPGLIPTVQTAPADEDFSTPWTLDEDRGDATVEDICNYIVEFMNNDLMVCLLPVLVPLNSLFLRFTGPRGR